MQKMQQSGRPRLTDKETHNALFAHFYIRACLKDRSAADAE